MKLMHVRFVSDYCIIESLIDLETSLPDIRDKRLWTEVEKLAPNQYQDLE